MLDLLTPFSVSHICQVLVPSSWMNIPSIPVLAVGPVEATLGRAEEHSQEKMIREGAGLVLRREGLS